jgi:hypothetical protein
MNMKRCMNIRLPLVLIVLPAVAIIIVAVALGPASPAAAETAKESLPNGGKLVALEVLPTSIDLKHRFDYRQLLVTAKLASGETIDATRMVAVDAPADLVKVSERGQVTPVKDGQGTVKLSLAGQSLSVPVKVSGQTQKYEVSFVEGVMPVMSKLGCNAGTCHGSAEGKNGFKLSLRGYDPLFDHRALIDDHAGRRFNRAAPDQSLMLLKPAGVVPHVGSVLTQPGERYYEIIRGWIADGSKLDLSTPRVAGIDIFPKNFTLPLPGMKQQIVVAAKYTDGSTRDVTAEAFVESSLNEVVECDKQGVATAVRRGEAAILARYQGSYAATTVIVMGDRGGFAWQDVPENNFIDTLVYKKLRQVKILPSALCTDEEFIRRVSLDVTGLLPSAEAVKAFLTDTRDTRTKRDALVDHLVGNQDYLEHWTNKWADMLQVNRNFLGEQGAFALRNWIRQAIAENRPYDRFAYEVLTASGSTLQNPPASYFKVLRTPEDNVENTTQLFLGVRFNCNKCHDHPFERWTQDQYYHLAAYFAQVGLKDDPQYKNRRIGGSAVEGAKAEVEIVFDRGGGEVTHARTGQVSPPKFPFEHAGAVPVGAARREQLARWIATKDNPLFAKSYVNRLWSYLLGPGLIDPVDDIRAGNPPSNPELLDRLTKEFIDSGFNAQHMLKLIAKSRVYQHSLETNKWNDDDKINFSHALPRRMTAEVLFDAVHTATGSVSQLPGVPAGFRAAQLPDSAAQLSDDFFGLWGKPPRESSCECERTTNVALRPILNLISGPTINNAIRDPNNRIAKLESSIKDDAKLVEDLFLAFYARRPTKEETAASVEVIRTSYQDELAVRKSEFAKYEKEIEPRYAAWLKSAGLATSWTVLDLADLKSAGGATLTKQPDASVLVGGTNPASDTYTVTAKTNLKGITGFRLEVLPHDSLAAKGPGRAPNGNFVLGKFSVTAAPAGKPAEPLAFVTATATFNQDGFSIYQAIQGVPQRGWAVAPRFGEPHSGVFEVRGAVGTSDTTLAFTTLAFTMAQPFGGQHTIGRFRLSATTSPQPRATGPTLPKPIADILAVPADKRTAAQSAELKNHYLSQDGEYQRLKQTLAEYSALAPQARLVGAQDLCWAMINSPAFLFNR